MFSHFTFTLKKTRAFRCTRFSAVVARSGTFTLKKTRASRRNVGKVSFRINLVSESLSLLCKTQLRSPLFNYEFSCTYESSLLYLQLCNADINECDINNGNCTQTCINIPGSYQCECVQGFQLLPDGRTCEGRDTQISTAIMYDNLSSISLQLVRVHY